MKFGFSPSVLQPPQLAFLRGCHDVKAAALNGRADSSHVPLKIRALFIDLFPVIDGDPNSHRPP